MPWTWWTAACAAGVAAEDIREAVNGRRQIVVWPPEQSRAEHCGVNGEALSGIGGVVPGERFDPVESVRDRADGQVQATGGFGGDAAGGEIGVEGG